MAETQAAPPQATRPRLTAREEFPDLAARPGLLGTVWRDRTARIGLLILVVLFAGALAAPLLAQHHPLELSGRPLERPSASHPLGTDGLGRDVLSRLLFGARLSLGSALLATMLVMVIGVVVGTVSGYVGGLVDTVLMRVVDLVLAFPGLILALAVASLFRPSLLTLMLALVGVWWAGYARIVRGLVLSVKERVFVEAAVATGARARRIVVRHVLPNVLPPVVVLATLEVGHLILAISGLTFLGLGAPPPTPEWGAMLHEGRTYFLSEPRVMLVPGVAISLAVLGFNLVGDGIRDALDVRLR